MREEEFPFSHFRDYGDIPDTRPDIDVDNVHSLDETLTKLKLIIVDDVTGSYRFNPMNRRGMLAYVGFNHYIDEMRHQDARPRSLALDVLLDHETKIQQVIHRATELQKSLGHFVFHGMRRKRALEGTMDGFASDYFIRDNTTATHCAEAIAELGHCMLYPHAGSMPSPTSEHAKYSVNLANNIMGFGSYATQDPSVLATTDGYTLMSFARNEQSRRLAQYKPRFDLTIKEFGHLQSEFNFSDNVSDEQLFAVKFE